MAVAPAMAEQVRMSAAPPPAVAVERSLGAQAFPMTIFEAEELHELHAKMASACAPARDAFVPLTVISGGRTEPGRPCLILHPGRSHDLRGLLGGWLRALAGPTCAADGKLSPALELWCAACNPDGSWCPLAGASPDARLASAGDGAAVGAARHIIGSAPEGVDLVERLLRAVPAAPSFVAVGVRLRRFAPELGCTFSVSAMWVDIGIRELEQDGQGLQSLREFLAGGVTDRSRPTHPLLELLAPTLRGERALTMVISGPASDPATSASAKLASLLKAALPEAKPPCKGEVVSVRPGFPAAHEGGADAPAPEAFQLFAGSFQELCCPPVSPLPELSNGEPAVRACGFPERLLPSLRPYLSRFSVTDADRRRLIDAAEAELAEFEENRWVTPGMRAHVDAHAPRPLYMQLADCYRLPDSHLTTTAARSYARSQDTTDPMVRTVRRIREDVALCAALLPITAAHPFNPVRLLRVGGVHSLLNLLSDASSLAPGHGEAPTAGEILSPAELAALALAALAAFAPVREFLVSQSIFELLAVTIKHPASDRHLLIFLALFTRVCKEPEHRRLAAEVVAPALAEQLPRLLGRTGTVGTGLAEAACAAAACLSPYLPVPKLAPVLRHLLGHLCGSAPKAFHHLACSFATSLRKSRDLDLDALVPRLLSLVPLDAPQGAIFQGAAAGLLSVCSHTAATTSLARRWVASTAAAVARQALRAGPAGLAELRVAVPLAAAAPPDGAGAAPPASCEWDPQVEEHASMLATLKWPAGELAKLGSSSTLGDGQNPPDLTQRMVLSAPSPPPELQREKLHGHARLLKLADMAESPNRASFGEKPQLRIAVTSERAEVFLSLSLMPVTVGGVEALTACGCRAHQGADRTAHSRVEDKGCGGQLGFWLCELPGGAEASPQEELRLMSHQLDLRPPLHASAAAPGETEHFVSVTLTRGFYTLVPFNSHEVVTTSADAAGALRTRCRNAGDGCVELNLAQAQAWERGAHFAAFSAWAECEGLEVFEAVPWHQRLEVEGELLAQSAPVWLCPPTGSGPVEVLVCTCSPGGDGEDPTRFRSMEPCLDIWPAVPSRRVRNERTGALRVHLPAVQHEQPVRLTCIWQEATDPKNWRQPPPKLVLYSLAPLRIHVPAVSTAPQRPLPGTCCAPPPQLAQYWQASALLSGSWTGGMSSGFGSLRNPQVAVEVLWPPGRGEEVQIDLYLFVPFSEEERQKRPSLAMTVFSRQEQAHLSGDSKSSDSSRLLEGQPRKELGSSKVVIGSYITAQVVLSGAEARAPFFVVLQSSATQEVWPWQLRIFARIRSGGKVASSSASIKDSCSSAGLPIAEGQQSAALALPAAQGEPQRAGGTSKSSVVPDNPPIRCLVLSGTSEPGRVYACWPDTLALYTQREDDTDEAAPGAAPPAGWVLARHGRQPDGLGLERLEVAAASGVAPAVCVCPGFWPPPEALPLPPAEDNPVAAICPPPPPPGARGDAGAVGGSSGAATKQRGRVPPPPAKLATPRSPSASAAPNTEALAEATPNTEAKPVDLSPAALLGPSVKSQVESKQRSDPRRWRRDRNLQHDGGAGAEGRGALPDIERRAAPLSERHARVAALQRRRRHGGYGEDEAEEDGFTTPRALSLPHTPRGDHDSRTAEGRSASKGLQAPDGVAEPGASRAAGLSMAPPASARKAGGAPELPPLPSARCARTRGQEAENAAADNSAKCCHFAGHPVFCCRAEAQWRGGPRRHLVRLERHHGADRLGFGNVAAGPPGAPVLVISWIRDGALAAWNAEAEAADGLSVPPQSAILAVNGVSGDVAKMREELREQVVEIEVMTPDRWRYSRVVGTT